MLGVSTALLKQSFFPPSKVPYTPNFVQIWVSLYIKIPCDNTNLNWKRNSRLCPQFDQVGKTQSVQHQGLGGRNLYTPNPFSYIFSSTFKKKGKKTRAKGHFCCGV